MNSVADQIRDAFRSRTPLRIKGAGTWLGAGRPVREARTLSVADDQGIVEYIPGDLTMTARAGTRLSAIASATRENGQWLPLDPWGGDDGTIGASVSTATAGPHAFAMGLPRDTVLGLEFVTGTGDIVRSGGKVVKNVAGFDLTRLLVGSWGTLGVITEVTVRLRARPEVTRTIAMLLASGALDDLAARLRALPFTPLASELVNESVARRVGLDAGAWLLVQLGGNDRSIRAQQDLLSGFGAARETDDAVWSALRRGVDGVASWRWSQLPSAFGQTWRAADRVALTVPGMMVHGNPARGVVRLVVPHEHSGAQGEIGAATRFEGTVVHEALPTEAWSTVRLHPASDTVSRGIREKFDPGGILNVGILGGGA